MDSPFNLRDDGHRFRMRNRITRRSHQMPKMRRLLFNTGRGGNLSTDEGVEGNEVVTDRYFMKSFRVIFL